MRSPHVYYCTIICLGLLTSCASINNPREKKIVQELGSIAVLPVEVVHLGRLHEVRKDVEDQSLGIEREGFILQRDLYRYFLREMKANDVSRTFLLDLDETNKRLVELEEISEEKIELSVQEICDWLGVQGIITGSIDQLAPGNALLAGLINGQLNIDSNVKINFSLRNQYGHIYWRYMDDRPTNKDNVYQTSKDLLKQASRVFFDLYAKEKSKDEKKQKKKRVKLGSQ